MAKFKHTRDSSKPIIEIDDADEKRIALITRNGRYRRVDGKAAEKAVEVQAKKAKAVKAKTEKE